MNNAIASHILASSNIEQLKDVGALLPRGMDDRERAERERELSSQLREGMKALGAKLGGQEDLAKAKDRLLTAMEAAGDLVGLGADGSVLRGGSFQGMAPEGRLPAQALRDLLNPSRAPKEGALYAFKPTAGGELYATEAKSFAQPGGFIAFDAKRIAQIAVGGVDFAIGGIDSVFSAAAECSANESRLAGISGNKVDAWSKHEVSKELESRLGDRLDAISPHSAAFPKPLDQADIAGKIQDKRAQAAPAPHVEPQAPRR